MMGHSSLFADAAVPEMVLIRNVRLIDRDGKAEDVTVSILIKDKKLDVVTKDKSSLPIQGTLYEVDPEAYRKAIKRLAVLYLDLLIPDDKPAS